MRLVFSIILAGLFVGTQPGCSFFQKLGFKKTNKSKNDPLLPGDAKPPATFPTTGDPIVGSGPAPSKFGGVLAGTVLDTLDNPVDGAYVRWVNLDDKDKNDAPIDVAVQKGYFTILGLKANKQYKLTARSKQGDRVMSGVAYATAPNARVVIRLRDGLTTAGVPPIPAAPAFVKEPEKKPKISEPENKPNLTAANQPSKQAPGWNGKDGSPQVEKPESLPPYTSPPVPPDWTPTPGGSWAPGIADKGDDQPPVLKTPAQKPISVKIHRPILPLDKPLTPPMPPPATGTGGWQGSGISPTVAPVPPQAPYCNLYGSRLENLVLKDLNGQPWEWKSDRRGKLVLLDFWGTHCIPCRYAIKDLHELQQRFERNGLEIIGIAYEGAPSFEQKIQAIRSVPTRYRQLVGSGRNCPVSVQFGMRVVPTMALLDQNGTILWRHEGALSIQEKSQLANLIRSRIGGW